MPSFSCAELGHQSSAMLVHRKSSIILSRASLIRHESCFLGDSVGFLVKRSRIVSNSKRFRSVFDSVPAKFVVSASLSSVITSGNLIAAAAAAASGSGSVAHAAVSSAIAHVAVTAVAIASGACLSTKVDFLWPRMEEEPDSIILEGVDITGYPIFNDAKVQKAISFARRAHHGQLRKTGDPYLTHCIHTGRILAALTPSSGKRAIDTVVAGILHDVVDDTCESLHSVEEEFGDDVAKLVAGVSRLSYVHQLLRRHRRTNLNLGALGPGELPMCRLYYVRRNITRILLDGTHLTDGR